MRLFDSCPWHHLISRGAVACRAGCVCSNLLTAAKLALYGYPNRGESWEKYSKCRLHGVYLVDDNGHEKENDNTGHIHQIQYLHSDKKVVSSCITSKWWSMVKRDKKDTRRWLSRGIIWQEQTRFWDAVWKTQKYERERVSPLWETGMSAAERRDRKEARRLDRRIEIDFVGNKGVHRKDQ